MTLLGNNDDELRWGVSIVAVDAHADGRRAALGFVRGVDVVVDGDGGIE